MTPDLFNGLFELIGALFQAVNIHRVVKDRGYAGYWLPGLMFFTSWGLWNLYYYPTLGQWWSFVGGISMVVTNLLWIACMLYYGRKP